MFGNTRQVKDRYVTGPQFDPNTNTLATQAKPYENNHINSSIDSIFFSTLYSTRLDSLSELKKDIGKITSHYNKEKKINQSYLLKNGFQVKKIDIKQLKKIKYVYYLHDSVVCTVLGDKTTGFEFLVNNSGIKKSEIDQLVRANILLEKYSTDNAIIYTKTPKLFKQVNSSGVKLNNLFSKKWHATHVDDIREVENIAKSVMLTSGSASKINENNGSHRFKLKNVILNDIRELRYIYKMSNGLICLLTGNNVEGFTFMYTKMDHTDLYVSKINNSGLIEQFTELDGMTIFSTNENWESDYFTFFTSN